MHIQTDRQTDRLKHRHAFYVRTQTHTHTHGYSLGKILTLKNEAEPKHVLLRFQSVNSRARFSCDVTTAK